MGTQATAVPGPGPGEVLAELASLLGGEDAAAAEALRGRLALGRLRLLFAGEAKRGKSTLVNALVGTAALPVGLLPCTSVATVVTAAQDDQPAGSATVHLRDGGRLRIPADRLGDYVTEAGNPANVRGVLEVRVPVVSPLTAAGADLVDTPGVGSVIDANTRDAHDTAGRVDAAVLVAGVDPPITQAERELLRRVRQAAVTLFCVLAKADRYQPHELAEVVGFTTAQLAAELGSPPAVIPVSARQGSAGVADLHDALLRYVQTRRHADLGVSVARSALRLVSAVREGAQAELATLWLDAAEAGSRLDRVRQSLCRLDAALAESRALAHSGVQALRRLARERARGDLAELTPRVVREVLRRATALPGTPAMLEERGRQVLQEEIGAAVQARHAELDQCLRDGLRGLAADLQARLDAVIAGVRDEVAAELGITLPPPPPAAELLPCDRLRLVFTEDPGTVESLLATVRTHLPGSLGRQRVHSHLAAQTELQLDRQLGRLQAAALDRLAGAEPALLAALDGHAAQGAGRLRLATERARELAQASRAQRRARGRELGGFIENLDRLAATLAAHAGCGPAAAEEAHGRPAAARS